MDRAWLNQARTLAYRDPEVALRELREIEIVASALDISDNVRHLRGNELKGPREYRQAALFAWGMSTRLQIPVGFCPVEAFDYDFIATWQDREARHFAPVQLKEFVSASMNPTAKLQDVIDRLARYRSETLTVCIVLNREGTFRPQELQIPPLRIGSLWFLFACAEDQSTWMLYGDALGQASATTFRYPT